MTPELIAILVMGLTIIGIHMTTFLYVLRRMDAMQRDIGEVRQEIGEVKERVARLEGILVGRLEVGNGTFTQQTSDD